MRTIGLIGGMSWHSSIEYYGVINERVAAMLGGLHSARVVLDSMDFDEIREFQVAEDWVGAGERLAQSGRGLVAAGADLLLIGTNLMHKVAPAVEAAVDVPLLHIADAVGAEAQRRDISTVGILGTSWVMGETFYADRLARQGIRGIAPDPSTHAVVDQVIFGELTQGIVREESRTVYRQVIEGLVAQGAEAIVLACTEIELLVRPQDSPVPLIDSMRTHAEAAAAYLLEDVRLPQVSPA